MLNTGNINGARDRYKTALMIDPSIRSFGKFILSYLLPSALRASTVTTRGDCRLALNVGKKDYGKNGRVLNRLHS